MQSAIKKAKKASINRQLEEARKIVNKYTHKLDEDTDDKVETKKAKAVKGDALKAYKELTRSIDEKIRREETKKNYKQARIHRKQLDTIKVEWDRIRKITETQDTEKSKIDEQWKEIEKKKTHHKKRLEEEWEKVKKAKEAEAPKTCDAANTQKAKQIKEDNDQRQKVLDEKEKKLKEKKERVKKMQESLKKKVTHFHLKKQAHKKEIEDHKKEGAKSCKATGKHLHKIKKVLEKSPNSNPKQVGEIIDKLNKGFKAGTAGYNCKCKKGTGAAAAGLSQRGHHFSQ